MTRYEMGEGGGGCFPAGVMISTPTGDRPIESLRVGDEVLSYDYDGKLCASRVTAVHHHPMVSIHAPRCRGAKRGCSPGRAAATTFQSSLPVAGERSKWITPFV